MSPQSSARHGGRRRQPSIRISRAHAACDPDILRGVAAHEYAHAVDARARRDIAVTIAGLLIVTLVPFAVYTYEHLSGQYGAGSADRLDVGVADAGDDDVDADALDGPGGGTASAHGTGGG
jgi:Zn-dependent protease with chaperone function